jgi:hypothetical protein
MARKKTFMLTKSANPRIKLFCAANAFFGETGICELEALLI